MSQMSNFAEIVATKRKEKGMTQGELATKLGISPQAVSKWENGLGLPDVTLFPMLAETLDISLEELFGMEPPQRIEEKIFVKEEVVSSGVPQKMNELPLAGIGSRRACYSAKPVVEQKGEKIFFGDGSEADLDGGSGDLKGKNLTVKDAELHTMGAADIEIGRITGFSTEKFSKDTTIKIGRRG